MYTKDKSKQIVLRVSESQYNFLKNIATVRGCNVSELVRGFIDYFLLLWSDKK